MMRSHHRAKRIGTSAGGRSLARAVGGAHTERVNKRSLVEQMIGPGSRPC
jgi:hypothetical protein